MAKLAEIFKTFGQEYMQMFPNLPREHRKVIKAIQGCRSGELGVAIYQCQNCGEFHTVNRSCGNRHCPLCQYQKSQIWLEKQKARQLPGPYFMITFTLPEELREFIRGHQDIGYSALFKASSQALKILAKDQKFIGTDLPGFTGVLHTWGRQLTFHPHIHYIVPGGGLSSDKSEWLPSSPGFYVPVKALSRIFKAKFKEEMEKANLLDSIDPLVWRMDWNVNSQAIGESKACLTYLTPYIFKVAIGESKIVSVKDRIVTFKYQKHGSRRYRTMSLDVIEFIRRFLQHVLPSGFMKVRHFGFMSLNCKIPIEDIQAMVQNHLDTDISLCKENQQNEPKAYCPCCGGILIYLTSIIPISKPYMDSS